MIISEISKSYIDFATGQEDIWKTLALFCAILLQQSANSRRTFQLIGNNIPFVYDIVSQELGME